MKARLQGFQGTDFFPTTGNCCILRAVLCLALGLGGFAELSGWAKPRFPVPPWPEQSLTKWGFDLTDASGTLRPRPLIQFNLALAESWSGYALSMAGAGPQLLQYPVVEGGGKTNLNLQTGSIRFWFQANWTSASRGGGGPGAAARLIEIGQCSDSADALCASLYLTSDGNELRFGLSAVGQPAGDWLQAPIAWQAGEWHLLTLTYSADAAALFLDGVRVAEGSGMPGWLAATLSQANVFSIGGAAGGDYLAQGQFEELATFDHPLSDSEVEHYYQVFWPTVQLGPLTPEEEKAGETAWVMEAGATPDGPEQDSDSQFSEEIPDYGCGLWLEITTTNAVATLTLHNTRPGAGYQILTNADLTTTNWSLFLTNVADGSGYLSWTNITIDLQTNLFFRACEVRDYVTNLVFPGLSFSNTLTSPPDSMGALGPNYFVELLNNGIAVYDKTGGLITNMDSRDFFAIGTNRPARMIDPRILYDHQSNRWVACAINPFGRPECILAVSNGDSPTNLLTGWSRYELPTNRDGVDTDFTTLGLDANGIYVRVAHRSIVSTTNAGHTIMAIKKSEIYTGSFLATSFDLTNDLDFKLWTVQPAVNFDDVATNGYAWFVAKGPPDLGTNYQGGEIYYRRLQWSGTNAVWADTNWTAVPNGSSTRNYYDLDGTNITTLPSTGIVAQALGGSVNLWDVGSRLAMPVLRNGFLWTCQTIGLNGTNGTYTGDKHGTNVDRSAIQWFKMQISPESATLTLSDHGRVFDSAHQTNAWWYHYPSLMVNCVGDMVAGFSGSSATNYIGAFYNWRLATGATLDESRIIRSGTIGHSGRWGDYSATMIDPADDWSFWTVQAYSTPYLVPNIPHWTTVVAKIRPHP